MKVALALGVAAALTACGSGRTTTAPSASASRSGSPVASGSPVRWSSALCHGILTLQDDAPALQSVGDTLQTDPASGQQAEISSLSALRADLTSLGTALNTVGAPSVTNGAAVQMSLTAGLASGEAALGTIIGNLQAVTSTDSATIVAAVNDSIGATQTALSAVGTVFDDAEKQDTSGDLVKAIAANPDCASMAASASASPS